MHSEDTNTFKHKVRVRACGLLEHHHKILLIKHDGIGKKGFLWSPPGGGVEFGESCENTIVREFKEETGLNVVVEHFLFINEFIHADYHALEVFFRVKKISGKLSLGKDPELGNEHQMLTAIRYFSYEEINGMDLNEIHNAFSCDHHAEHIFNLKGMIKFHNI